jgi:diguanylate cyclase (GGDEF)-like protein
LAANNDGIWSENAAAIDLRVYPAPWRSGWAYAFYGVVMLGSAVLLLRRQRRHARLDGQKRLELETLVETRTQELAQRNQDLEELNHKLKEASVTDTLTGLRNRRFYYEIVETELARIQRQHADKPSDRSFLFIMMIDLDGFKAINDANGHHAGDMALSQVSDILRGCCRSTDTVFRWGGDEFLILGAASTPKAVETFAERLRVELASHEYSFGNGESGRLSGSIGFVLYPFFPNHPHLVHWEILTSLADQAAYLAKENQRNAWVGIYGRANAATGKPGAIGDEDLEALYEQGLIEIRTSIRGELNGLAHEPRRKVL